METLAQLHAKLDRTQTEIENGIGDLIKQRALVAYRLGENEDVTQSRELLASLEETQLIHVRHRDLLRRKLDWMLAGSEARSYAIPPVWRVTVSHAILDLIFRASAHFDQARCSAREMSVAGRRSPRPVIVTEQHADPVELLFQAFLRLDREQRARLAQRLRWRLDGPTSLKGPR